MELGIYDDATRVYAPYYRQATFPVYSLSQEEQEKYLIGTFFLISYINAANAEFYVELKNKQA